MCLGVICWLGLHAQRRVYVCVCVCAFVLELICMWVWLKIKPGGVAQVLVHVSTELPGFQFGTSFLSHSLSLCVPSRFKIPWRFSSEIG